MTRTVEGMDALSRGAWQEAKAAFEGAVGEDPSPQALEGLAHATRFLGEASASLEARERAFRAYREAGDRDAAARTAAWLAYDSVVFRGDAAVGRGWFARAHRLLDEAEDAEEAGWLAFLEGEVVLLAENDTARAGELAATATAIGRRAGITDLELLGLSLEGLAAVAAGDVSEGMRLLDEATAAAVSGEFAAPHFAGAACCHMIYACERVRDVDRAAQWCQTVRGICERWHVPQLFGFCRSHYASVLIWRGEWDEAEAELSAATEAFERGAPALVFEALVRLAELRRRQGRLDEAEELCERISWHPDATLCLAEVAYDREDFQHATDLLDRHRRSLSPADALARSPAIELAVRVAIASGSLDVAEETLTELRSLSETVESAPLRASVRFSEGLLAMAKRRDEDARRELEDAVDIWSSAGAPLEAAAARIELGRVLRRSGRAERAVDELRRAAEALSDLGATREAERAQALLDEAIAAESGRGSGEKGPLSERELEVLRLAASGLTDGEISERLVVSPHTVHRHMANIRAKLGERSKAGVVAKAAREGLL